MSSQRAADGELTCAIHSLAALIEFLVTTAGLTRPRGSAQL